MANKKISELPYIGVPKISGNTLVPLVTYFSAATGDTVHTYISDLQTYLISGLTGNTDVFVTGGTYSAGTITITNNTGGTFNITGVTFSGGSSVVGNYLPLSGGTVTGQTFFTSGVSISGSVETSGSQVYHRTDLFVVENQTINGSLIEATNYGVNIWSSNTNLSIDAENRLLYDSVGGISSIDWENRQLVKSDGSTVSFDWENGVLTGQTNIESSTISATTYQNLPDNVTGNYLPLSGGTVTGDTTFTSGVTINYLDFDTTPTVPSPTGGTLYYNSTENALSYKPITPSNDVTVNLGQESIIRIYNNSGVQINNGQALHITGSTSGSPTVSLAVGEGGSASQFQISGIATHDIPNSSFGFMTVFGTVRDINLTGFTVGEQIYLSQTVPGGLSSYSGLSFTGRTCEVGHILDNSASGKLQVAILNELEGTIITAQENNILSSNSSSTGVFHFSGLTIDTPSGTTFSVAPVDAWIIDNVTSPTNPTIQLITYPGSTGNTSLYYSSATETYVLLTSGLTLTQQTTFPTPQQRRQNLYLGKFGHGNKQFLINEFNEPDSSLSPVSQLRDMFTAIKLVNDSVIASANGVNLNINTSAGVLYGLGIGYVVNNLNPNTLTINSQSPATFQYRTQTGGTSTNTTLIDPLNYDVGGVKTALTGTKATNQRIYLLQNGQIRIQYGQTNYNQLSSAVAALQNETFVTFPNFRDNGVLICILSVLSTCTDLTDTNKAQFFSVSKFGELIGAAGGASTTTLQQSYNNSVTPEITTNSTLGALSVKNGDGTLDNVTNVFEGVNASGTTTSFVRADGNISGFSFTTAGFSANTGGLTATTISATTYQNLPISGLTAGSNINVTGSSGNFTISVTGLINNYLPISGGTVTGNTIFTSGLTANTLNVTGNTNIKAFTGTTGYISGSGQNILTVIGSGNSTTSPLFTVQGSSGELFSVNDSLVGSLFSVNDISGLPILEVFSDNTTLMGSYQSPSLNTTTKVTLTAGTNTVYSIPTSAYTGAFIDYTLVSTGTTGARAGQIMSIWSGTSANFTETSTTDIGTTAGVTFTVVVSGNNAVLSSSATTAGWTVKTIIRSI